MENPDDKYREVFGGSDSELSSDEGDDTRAQYQERTVLGQDDEFQSDEESGDEYRQQDDSIARKPRKKSAHIDSVDVSGSKKRKRKTKHVYEEQDLNDLPPEQANKIRLDMQIEAILKPRKNAKPRRKKKDDDEDIILDKFADEEVSRLRDIMLNAAMEDDTANKNKLPATAKLKILPLVIETLRKSSMAQAIVDNNLLDGVRRWLEPLPDKSLPALNIQRAFFPILQKMEFIDATVLKESRLGRIILFYTKCKRVSPDLARIAKSLVEVWSRPIIKRSASFRDRVIPVTSADADDAGPQATMKLNTIMARAKEREKGRVRKNVVAIPQRELGTYTIAPKADFNRGSESVANDVDRRRKNAERLRTLTRRVATSKA